jgi:hypothetical protein
MPSYTSVDAIRPFAPSASNSRGGDLDAALGHHRVASAAADVEVDLDGGDLAAMRMPPAPDELGVVHAR